MTFLEMAQVVGATQAAEKNNIELNEDCLLYTSDAADEEDRSKIKEWMTFLEMAQVVGATQAAEKNNIELNEDQQASAPDPAMIAMFTNIVKEMFDYGRDILLKRRKDPKDDLLSVIANMEVDGEKLPDEYLDGSWLLIIIAGN